MTYHHQRRLTEHWPDNATHLRPAASLVAVTIAAAINKETSQYKLSAKTISSRANGLSRGAIDKAVKQLEALGIFAVTRSGQRQAREFRLLVECPQGCERGSEHYTPREQAALQETNPNTHNAVLEHPMPTLENSMLTLEQPMPILEQSMLTLLATNKSNKNKINQNHKPEEKPFEFLVIEETLRDLERANKLTSRHTLLKAAFTENPEPILIKAKEIRNTPGIKSPKAYLTSAIKKHPESLLPKDQADPTWKDDYDNQRLIWQRFTSSPEHTESVRKQYEEIRSNNSDLISWDFIWGGGPDYADFMVRTLSSGKLSTTAAAIASEAAQSGVNLRGINTITEAVRLIENPALEVERGAEITLLEDLPGDSPEPTTGELLAKSRATLAELKLYIEAK